MKTYCFIALILSTTLAPCARSQQEQTRQLIDFNAAKPYITKFYDRYWPVQEAENGYIFQLVLGLDNGLRRIITPPSTHVRLCMGWSAKEKEHRTVLWPANHMHQPTGVTIGIYKIKNNNGCRPYCDFTNFGAGVLDKECSGPHTFQTSRTEADEFIRDWEKKNPLDDLTNFYLDRQIILEMDNFRMQSGFSSYDYIRIYHGLRDDDRRVLIVIPVTEEGKGHHDFVWIQDAGGLCDGACPMPEKRRPLRKHWWHRRH